MSRKTEADIKREIETLEREAQHLKQQTKLQALIDDQNKRITATEKAHHDRKAEAYLAWYASKQYIDGLAKDLAETGTLATNAFTATEVHLKVDSKTDTFKTFSHLKEGALLQLASGHNVIVTGFTEKGDGSEGTLMYLTSKFKRAETAHLPYSDLPGKWNPGKKELITANQHRLNRDSVVIIDGVKMVPTAYGVDKNFCSYTLQAL